MDDMRSALNSPIVKIVLAVLALCVAGWFCFKAIYSLWAETSKIKQEISILSPQLGNVGRVPIARKSLIKNIEALRLSIKSKEENFFHSGEQVIKLMDRFAQESKITLRTIAPKEPIKKKIPNYNDISLVLHPANIKMKCTYPKAVAFLEKIENTEKLILIDNISIKGNTKNIWEHDVSIDLSIPTLEAKR